MSTETEMSRALLIKAKGGLGNRILSAVTGLVYADLSGRTPIIDWRDGMYAPHGENAYPLLFQSPRQMQPELCPSGAPVTPAIWQGKLDRDTTMLLDELGIENHSGARLYRQFCIDMNRVDQSEQIGVFWSYLPKMPRLRKHLARDPRFRGDSLDSISTRYLSDYFKPQDHILKSIDRLMSGIPRPVIGVHVRYTDLKVPLDKVLNALRRQLAKAPSSSVFLATDSAEVETRIRSEFQKVYVHEKGLPEDGGRLHTTAEAENKLADAANAMIDMWGLAACDHLIFSSVSTFSVTSSLIGDMSPSQLTDVEKYDPTVMAKRFLRPRL